MRYPLPVELIKFDSAKLKRIDEKVKEIYRLITFSRDHYADHLLDRFIASNNTLAELLSIKNAQMEAESEEDVQGYIENLNQSIHFVVEEISNGQDFENLAQLFNLFRIISPETHAKHPNKFRTTQVQIGASLCPEPQAIQPLVDQVFYNLKHIDHPVIRAIYLHHELIWIHPFADGNGRTIRIAQNWMLMYNLYPPIFIEDEAGKKIYLNTLESSFKALERAPDQWNSGTASFFDQVMDRILINAERVLHDIS